jgi:glucose/arabinose dehydrogenase
VSRRTRNRRKALSGLALAALASVAAAAPIGGSASAGLATGNGDGGIELHSIGQFQNPVFTAFAPGRANTVYVVEQAGTVQAVVNGVVQPQTFLDIRDRTGFDSCDAQCGEQGLLSIAFDPGFAVNGAFYAYYTNTTGDIELDEFHTNSPTDADESSRAKVISVRHRFASNHNGGTVAFGPDGYLYMGTGDGGIADDPHQNSQDKDKLLGKLLRLDVDGAGTEGGYAIPQDNPYVGKKGRDEIMAIGLRNPYRFSFNSNNDNIAIGDVGQDRWEEIDYEKPAKLIGANFGWDRWEGTHRHKEGGRISSTPFAGKHDKPIHEYSHKNGCSITGGILVTDPDLPSLYGRYLYADFCAGQLRSLVPSLSEASGDHKVGVAISSPTSLRADPNNGGDVYVSSLDGDVYRIDPLVN